MESEGGKSCLVLGSIAEKDEQELKAKYNSSENHGLDHVMLDSVGASGPGVVGVDPLFAVTSLDSKDIKKMFSSEATALDSTDIKENSHCPGVAETCKRRKTIENDFNSSNLENLSQSFKDSIGETSHFPDEANKWEESLVGIDSECRILTAHPNCSEKNKKKRRKKEKSIACESNNKICYLQDRTSAENNLTDRNEFLKPAIKIITKMKLEEEKSLASSFSSENGKDEVKKCNCCMVRQDLIDVHHLDKGCQDCPLEIIVLDSADTENKSISLGFTDVKSSKKDRGDSLLDVAELDSNDIKEKMASSGVTNFKNFEDDLVSLDCRDFNLDIKVLNTTNIKEKPFASGEPSIFLEGEDTGSLNTHGGHAEVNEVNDTLLESRDKKAYKKRKTAGNYLVNQVKLPDLRNSSNSYDGSTRGTSHYQLGAMYAVDLLKRKLESRDLGMHAISEKISEDNLKKKAESNCSGDGHIFDAKKEGIEISLADNSCTQSYLKYSSKLVVSEGNFEQKCRGKLERTYFTKHESSHIDDGLSLMDMSLNNYSESDPLCRSSKSKSIQIETTMDEAPSSSHLGALKDDPDLDTVTKVDDLSQILNPSPERYMAVDSRKKLLILDVNGLLVDFVNYFPKGHTPDTVISKKAGNSCYLNSILRFMLFKSCNLCGLFLSPVFKRPYCDEFLQFCFDRFNVGVWSSRTK